MKKLNLILLCFTSFYFGYSQVVINEYSAANYSDIDFLPGPEDAYEDWVELYNNGAATIDLSGYYLSDKSTDKTKWQFPAGVSIAPNGHLTIVCDSENGFSNGFYHTNFKLTQTKGNDYIILSDANQVVVDSVYLNNPNQTNHSTGRVTDGAATWGVFENTTQGSANANAMSKYADPVLYSIAPGFYNGTQNLVLTTTEPNSSIRYTTDGSEPSALSNLYSSAIPINSTTVVRARVYSTDPMVLPSHIETNTYFINVTHSVKVISVCGDDLFDLFDGTQFEPLGSIELFETDGSFLTEATGEFNKHGNDSWFYDQRGVDFIARDQFGINHALEDEIFDNKDRDEFQRVILKCGASDNYPFETGGAHIRDAYINEMSQLGDLRLDERSNEFAVLYLNGDYWGVYDIREKTDDSDFTTYYYDQDVPNIQYLKTWGGTWEEYGAPNAQTDWDNLVNFIDVNNMTVQANYDYVDSLYNTGSLIDYFILNGFVVCADWLNWNTGWWRGLDPNGDKKKWRYTLWDMDASFGHYINYTGIPNQTANADPCDPESLGDPGGQGHVPIWNKLLTNDEFFEDYINRYAELTSSVFTCDSMHNLLDSMVAEIAPEMPAHIAKWGGTVAEWEANVQAIHDFIDTRCVNVPQGLVNCNPEISGPYQVVINVDPPLSGEVELSSITPNNYPYYGTYFGGVNIDIDADAFTGWQFSHWTIENDTIFPNVNAENAFLDISDNDSIVAHFIPYVPQDTLTFIAVPAGSGTVTINGTNIGVLPTTEYVNQSSLVTLAANANTGFTFSNWAMSNHTPNPNTTSINISINTNSNDTIYLYFDSIPVPERDTVVYMVDPVGAGTMNINGNIISTFPFTDSDSTTMLQSISAIPNANYVFSFWDANNNLINNPTQSSTDYTLIANDTITAHFDTILLDSLVIIMLPNNSGTLDVEGDIITSSPFTGWYTPNSILHLNATPNSGNSFLKWELNTQSLPDYNPSTSFYFNNQDTLFAYFNTPTYINDLGKGVEYCKVYPTFNEGDFTIEYQLNKAQNIQCYLSDINGKMIQSWEWKHTFKGEYSHELSFEGSSGIYLLHIQTEHGHAIIKMRKI